VLSIILLSLHLTVKQGETYPFAAMFDLYLKARPTIMAGPRLHVGPHWKSARMDLSNKLGRAMLALLHS
jgi:hypothetical protein